jgi:predicted MFS family arabinose efflux permease
MISPNTLITAAAPPKHRGSFMSLKSATQQLAIGLSAFISGQIVVLGENNLYSGYYKIGFLAIFFGLITIWLMNHVRVAEGNQ